MKETDQAVRPAANRGTRLRAWAAALLWLAILYASAPVVFSVVQWTRKHFSLDWYSYAAGGILIAVAGALAIRVALRQKAGFPARLKSWLAFLLLLLATAYLFWITPGGVAKIHLLQYGLLALLILRAVLLDIADRLGYAIALALCGIAGLGDELLQGLWANRVGDLPDVGMDLLASLLGLGYAGLGYSRRATASSTPLTARSIRWLMRSLIAASLSLAIFCTFNPDVRFGLRHENTPAGTFYSLLTLEQLNRQDERLAETRAEELDAWYDAQEQDFQDRVASLIEKGKFDRQTAALFLQIRGHWVYRNRLMQAFEPAQAWIETQIGDALYQNLLTEAPPGWNDVVRKSLDKVLQRRSPKPPYVSGFVPEATPLYSIHAADDSWSAQSSIPEASLSILMAAHREDYRKIATETFLSAYRRFLNQYTSRSDPFLREMRVHLFLRDRYAYWCDYRIAYGENRILETYFGRTLRKTRFAWPGEVAQRMKAAGFEDPNFASRVGENYIFWTNLGQVWLFCLALAVLLGAAGALARRRFPHS